MFASITTAAAPRVADRGMCDPTVSRLRTPRENGTALEDVQTRLHGSPKQPEPFCNQTLTAISDLAVQSAPRSLRTLILSGGRSHHFANVP